MSTSPKRILFAGGGTGGHVFPIVYLIQQIYREAPSSYHIYRAGSRRSLEQREADAQPNITFLPLFSGKRRREKSLGALLHNMWDMLLLSLGVIQAVYYLLTNHIDTIFCKGGYVALPIVLASFVTRTPLLVHESDTCLGLTNRIASRRASHVFTAYPGVFSGEEVVGQLLSADIAYPSSSDDFSQLLNTPYDDSTTYVLVMGGSQGARSMYQTVSHVIQTTPQLSSGAFHYVIVGGLLQKSVSLFPQSSYVTQLGFLHAKQLQILYQYCDIAITRAGSTSLAEQKLRDMKLIMIPIPRTHDQYTNAQYYVDTYDDILLSQDDNLPRRLTETLGSLVSYHKTLVPRERDVLIAQPKQTIIKYLFS